MNSEIELVIFDLDGTLYEGTDHFDYYAEQLKQHVDPALKDKFSSEYERMKMGDHPVTIGKAYDVKRDLVLTIDPMTIMVSAASDWDGELLSQDKVAEYYSDVLQFDFEEMIAIGDGWWLPFVTAKHFGVEDCYPSYLATKEYMVTDQFTLEKLEGLRENLIELKKEKNIVLMTNSDSEDVGRLLKELALDGVFDHIITSAKKPSRTTPIFEELLKLYEINPEQALSVGDNFINEIAPALLLGMQAKYITPHSFKVEHKNLEVIPSVTAMFLN